MADLEQVKPYIDPASRKVAFDIIDAHLKKDAEREARLGEAKSEIQHRARDYQRRLDELRIMRTELAELREQRRGGTPAAQQLIETQKNERRLMAELTELLEAVRYEMNHPGRGRDRLRQLIEEQG